MHIFTPNGLRNTHCKVTDPFINPYQEKIRKATKRFLDDEEVVGKSLRLKTESGITHPIFNADRTVSMLLMYY